jgi:hypothetical protein
MPKVIKIKESEIRKIAKTILEQGFDDFDTQIQPEELGGGEDIELTLGQDEHGNFYVMKNAHKGAPEIVARVK